jgi:transcriptional repressor OPI1
VKATVDMAHYCPAAEPITSTACEVVRHTSAESQQPTAYHKGPPPFSAVPMTSQQLAMDLEYENAGRHRAASVLSGMSQEDMEAAETLNSLQARKIGQVQLHEVETSTDHPKDYHSPSQQPPPRLIQSQTTYSPDDQPEPLFSLLTSQYPLTASMLNRSLSVYRGTQSLIPGAYTVERNVGLPLASMLGRVTGVEGGIRWALQTRRRDSNDAYTPKPDKADVEAGMEHSLRTRAHLRRGSGMSEQLPAYDDAGRSPPYQEQQLVPQTRDGQTPPGWRAQLMISTSGLGIAMSEESLRSLRYCLSWLRWANERLGGAILSLNDVLKRWNEDRRQDSMPEPAVAGSEKPSKAALAARIQELRGVVLQTLIQVVDVVSNYAGGALPENARNLVHRHITSLPLRFRLASSMSCEENGGNEGAQKVMMLAQEGLNMMGQVSGVVNDTLVSAESWCEKLGRRQGQQEQHARLHVDDMKVEGQSQHIEHSSRATSTTSGKTEQMDVDVKMEG